MDGDDDDDDDYDDDEVLSMRVLRHVYAVETLRVFCCWAANVGCKCHILQVIRCLMMLI
jgi:hypothetical protein